MENELWRNGKAAALEGIAHDDLLVRHAQPLGSLQVRPQ
jgi:hypothetical protein